MSAPDWPASLPQALLRDGFGLTLPDNLLRDQPEYGPPLVRRRTSANTWPLAGALNLTLAQWNDLVAFIDDELDEGALPFNFPNPLGGDHLLVQFAGPPSLGPAGVDTYRVAIKLEVLS